MVKTIEAYKTDDGQLHEDRTSAYEHQALLDLTEGIQNLVNVFWYPGMHVSDIVDILIRGRVEFYDVFQRNNLACLKRKETIEEERF